MLENLRNYLYFFLYENAEFNTPFTALKSLLLDYGVSEEKLFHTHAGDNCDTHFVFSNNTAENLTCLIKSKPDFFAKFESEIVPKVEQDFPVLKGADLSDRLFWKNLIKEYIAEQENNESMLAYAKNSPSMYAMSFPHTNNTVSKYSYGYSLKFYNIFENSPNLALESELVNFGKMFFSTMIETYKECINSSKKFPPAIKDVMNNKIRHFEEFHCKMFNLPAPEVTEEIRAYTKEELEQQQLWGDEFEIWWENEGQYHRAGGTDYDKTFAWYAWLNREELRQKNEEALMERIRYLEAKLEAN